MAAIALSAVLVGVSCAQDKLMTLTGVQEGKIVGVKGANIMFELPGGKGTIGIPMATVKRVVKEAPPEYLAAVLQYQQGKYAEAQVALAKLVSTFGGLQTDWAMGANSLLGDVYVALGKYADAEKAYQSFKSRYPGATGSDRAEVGMARIQIEKKQFDEARTRLAPFAERALKQMAPDSASSALYGQVFVLMGRIEEAGDNKPAALENYLRTVTIFRDDAAAVEEADKRAKDLASANVVVP